VSSLVLFYLAMGAQGFLIFWDEFYYHRKRGLPQWERIGHPVDTLSVILPFIYMSFLPYPGFTPTWLISLMVFSCLLITKDEAVHAEKSPAGEHWLHALLFMIHPLLFITAWKVWSEQGPALPHHLGLSFLSSFFVYQITYWNFFAKKLPKAVPAEINNELYHDLGERWYTAKDDPVALLRAEAKTKNPWVTRAIQNHYPNQLPPYLSVLDVGCGAGFLANDLARAGFRVQGVDLSENSLKVAGKHDTTRSVHYHLANAYALPFANESFDAITCMDFLEHVESPERVIAEAARVLKPGGIFVFHTFNRNPLAHFIIIKGMEWFVKNTPKHLHVIRLFVKPSELKAYCREAKLEVQTVKGIAPKLGFAFFKMLFTGLVPEGFRFKITRSTLLSYVGFATKSV
jgi:2-polyprenyl-6-hydroxyphenyl methylase/3-demethylubiquinone-9 3-methyltransferase